MTQSAESKLLRAEYGLDFAVQTAERALLAAREALAAEEKGNKQPQQIRAGGFPGSSSL